MKRRVAAEPAIRAERADGRDPAELSDADLEVVVGGLWRAWPGHPVDAERAGGSPALFEAFVPPFPDGATGR